MISQTGMGSSSYGIRIDVLKLSDGESRKASDGEEESGLHDYDLENIDMYKLQ